MLNRPFVILIVVLLMSCRTVTPSVSIPQDLTTHGQRYSITHTTPLKSGSTLTFGPFSATKLVITKNKPATDSDGTNEQVHRGVIFSFVMTSKTTPQIIPVDCAILVLEKRPVANIPKEHSNKSAQTEDFLRCSIARDATVRAADFPQNGIDMKFISVAKVGSLTISPLPYVEASDNKLLAPSGYKISLATGPNAGVDLMSDQHFYIIPHDATSDLYLATGAAITTIYTVLKHQIADI